MSLSVILSVELKPSDRRRRRLPAWLRVVQFAFSDATLLAAVALPVVHRIQTAGRWPRHVFLPCMTVLSGGPHKNYLQRCSHHTYRWGKPASNILEVSAGNTSSFLCCMGSAAEPFVSNPLRIGIRAASTCPTSVHISALGTCIKMKISSEPEPTSLCSLGIFLDVRPKILIAGN